MVLPSPLHTENRDEESAGSYMLPFPHVLKIPHFPDEPGLECCPLFSTFYLVLFIIV